MAEYFKRFDPFVMGLKKPRLTIRQVLAWADVHRAATGEWPTAQSGVIRGSVFGTTWGSVNQALIKGLRGLPGGQTLSGLLCKHSGREVPSREEIRRAALEKARRIQAEHRARRDMVELRIERIMAWADAYHASTGRWPTPRDGPIAGCGGETWSAINRALVEGRRGLPGGSSLARLLNEQRPDGRGRLSVAKIRAWALADHAATGQWPRRGSGAVVAAPGEKWYSIDDALARGWRGLPGGSSLAQLRSLEWDLRG
jgi:hypothetical protein